MQDTGSRDEHLRASARHDVIPAPRSASEQMHELAEGPFWDAPRARLLWVDIRRGSVFSGELGSDGTVGCIEEVSVPGTAGAVAAAEDGSWIIAGSDRLWIRSPEGVLTAGATVLPPTSGRRLNDGKPDPAGRYLVGSLSLSGPSTSETLVSIDHSGGIRVLDDDLTLSNGLAWSADGRTLYSVDTERRVVFRRDYDPSTGDTGPRSVFLEVTDGYPDGMCIDAEEHLWIAMWGLGEVHRYSPAGEQVDTVAVPAPHVSSAAFAGEDLGTLVITTARQDLDSAALSRFPDSGRLFTVRVPVPGLPQPLWSGSASETVSSRGAR